MKKNKEVLLTDNLMREVADGKAGAFEQLCTRTYKPLYNYIFRRLRNATSRINTAFFVRKNEITPHWIWYNRVVKKPLTITQERSYSDTYDTI